MADRVDTSGGAYIAGRVVTGGGDFTGRDSIRIGNVVLVVNVPAGGKPRAFAAGDQATGEVQELVQQVVGALQAHEQQLSTLGVQPGIAQPPALPAGPDSGGRPVGPAGGLWSSIGHTAPTPTGLDGGAAARLSSAFVIARAQLQRVDQQVSAQVVEMAVGSERVSVVNVLLQQGNLALWRFREAASRLASELATADFRARLDWPWPPEIHAVQAQARTNVDVLRGLALVQMLFLLGGQPGALMSATDQLLQGRWSQVLDNLRATGVVDAETAMYMRAQLQSFGQPYNPAEVATAVRQAEQVFSQALEREPGNTAALVNLATLRAESALSDYIATGSADRDRLTSAHQLFARASLQLRLRSDQAGLSEAGKCRLYAALALPPHADLQAVPLAAAYTQLVAAAHNFPARQTIRWDVFERMLARNAVEFVDQADIAEGRDLLARAGEAALADQCARMMQQIQAAPARRVARAQWIQISGPVVGSWRYQGGSYAVAVGGVIVFDAEGGFHWFADARPASGAVAERSVSQGGYQVMDRTIGLQGFRWLLPRPQPWGPQSWGPMPAMTVPPAPFTLQMAIQGWNPEQLYLAMPDGVQVQCQRL